MEGALAEMEKEALRSRAEAANATVQLAERDMQLAKTKDKLLDITNRALSAWDCEKRERVRAAKAEERAAALVAAMQQMQARHLGLKCINLSELRHKTRAIADGGYGQVFAVHDAERGQEVAVKLNKKVTSKNVMDEVELHVAAAAIGAAADVYAVVVDDAGKHAPTGSVVGFATQLCSGDLGTLVVGLPRKDQLFLIVEVSKGLILRVGH